MSIARSLFVCLILIAPTVCSCGKKKDHHEDAAPAAPTPGPAPDAPLTDREVRLRGYVELSQIVEVSMMRTADEFSFANYVGGAVSFFLGSASGIAPLMGYYSPNPVTGGWQNTSANTIAVSAHLLAFNDLGEDLAKICVEQGAELKHATPTEQVRLLIKEYCDHGSQMNEGELRQLWRLLTADLAPESEFDVWREQIKQHDGLSGAERVVVLVSTAMSSPWVMFHY